MKVENILETIGQTPLVHLNQIEKLFNLKGKLYAKVESFNPGGSVKDRPAYNMIRRGIEEGSIDTSTTLIEPTSGNTGIAIAMVGAVLKMRVIIVMPDTMTIERRKLIKQYGAELVLTDGKLGMPGSIEKAEQIHKEIGNSIIVGQFVNEYNPESHMLTTALEILDDMNNEVDAFVAGIGTGGTVTGVGRVLKKKNNNIKVFGVEPFESPFLTENRSGNHRIQGIGAGFKPEVLDLSVIDEVLTVKSDDAISVSRLLTKEEGILAGISSGAALSAGIELAKKEEYLGKNIVVLLPDTGERYLSSKLFEE